MDKTYAHDIENPGDTIYINFQGNSVKLDKQSKLVLDSLAATIKKNSDLGVRIISSTRDLCGKCGKRSWDRIEKTVNYLSVRGANTNQIGAWSLLDGEYNRIAIVIGT